ncbi:hypothetical protein JCM5353_006005 [Sporobolomyces roseus]
MSFSSLPEELVNHIISKLERPSGIGIDPDGKTLLNLCLVSRHTLNPARQALYRYPFWSTYPHKFNWRRAKSLLTSLEADDNSLGQLVQGNRRVTEYLHALIRDHEDRDDSVERTMGWFEQLLEACPRIQQVELSFKTIDEFENLLEILSLDPSTPEDGILTQPIPLRSLKFARLFYDDEEAEEYPELSIADRFFTSDIFNTLKRTSITALDELVYYHVGFVHFGCPSNKPRFPFPVKSLRIDSLSDTLATSIPLFPRNRSTLEQFKFSGFPPLNQSEIQALPHLLGTNLKLLSLYFHSVDFRIAGEMFPISEYASPSEAPSIPLETFRSFPHLTSLTLNYTHGPSLRLFEILSVSSPLLAQITLLWSFWICDFNPRSSVPDEIFPKQQILETLDKFQHLNDIHFGFLPTVDVERYEDVVTALKSRGVKANGLLRALEANDYALGRLVRGTSGINQWLRTTGDDPRIQKWYCAVLRACPNLRQVDLHFSTQTELEDLLRNVALSDRTTPQNFPFHSTLPSATPISRLQCLDFNDLYWNQDNGSTPPFPFAIKHLHIRTRKEYLADSIALSSRFPPSLETFTSSSDLAGGTIDLNQCTTHHGSHLRKLELKFNDYRKYDRLKLSKYTTTLPDVKIVLEGFRPYPLLTSLILNGAHGPSLHFLSTLAESSPLLHNLDLTNSRWISDSNPLSTVPDEIFPETRVLSALEAFKHLRTIHLDILPTTANGKKYEVLVGTLKSRGAELRYDCCAGDD